MTRTMTRAAHPPAPTAPTRHTTTPAGGGGGVLRGCVVVGWRGAGIVSVGGRQDLPQGQGHCAPKGEGVGVSQQRFSRHHFFSRWGSSRKAPVRGSRPTIERAPSSRPLVVGVWPRSPLPIRRDHHQGGAGVFWGRGSLGPGLCPRGVVHTIPRSHVLVRWKSPFYGQLLRRVWRHTGERGIDWTLKFAAIR